MTGEVKKWPVKRHFWPVIVRWPAVILSPDIAQIYMWSNALLQAKVDFAEGGKPENSEINPRSTGETNYNNSTHMSSKLFFWESTRGYTIRILVHVIYTRR